MLRKSQSGFTLMETLIATAICAITFTSTIGLLNYAMLQNEVEQERSRAFQMVCEAIEVERCQLFTWTQSQAQQTIWDNNTDTTSDDTTGLLEVVVRDADTGAVLTQAPEPARLVSIEATMTWQYRGAPQLGGKFLRETVMSYKAP